MYPMTEMQSQSPNAAVLRAIQQAQAMEEQERMQEQALTEQQAGLQANQLAQMRNQPLDAPLAPPPTNSAQTAQSAMPMYLSFMGGGMGGMMGGAAGGAMGGASGSMASGAAGSALGSSGAAGGFFTPGSNFSSYLNQAGSTGSGIADLMRYGMSRWKANRGIRQDNREWLGGY